MTQLLALFRYRLMLSIASFLRAVRDEAAPQYVCGKVTSDLGGQARTAQDSGDVARLEPMFDQLPRRSKRSFRLSAREGTELRLRPGRRQPGHIQAA
jgi:hypothetical protein